MRPTWTCLHDDAVISASPIVNDSGVVKLAAVLPACSDAEERNVLGDVVVSLLCVRFS